MRRELSIEISSQIIFWWDQVSKPKTPFTLLILGWLNVTKALTESIFPSEMVKILLVLQDMQVSTPILVTNNLEETIWKP